jgi:hypothetical protein
MALDGMRTKNKEQLEKMEINWDRNWSPVNLWFPCLFGKSFLYASLVSLVTRL